MTSEQALAAAENDLAAHRQRLNTVLAWIHDPTIPHAPRADLAHRLGLPAPQTERTPT
ncbi:hypothetical protein [Streptomyces zhihengii]